MWDLTTETGSTKEPEEEVGGGGELRPFTTLQKLCPGNPGITGWDAGVLASKGAGFTWGRAPPDPPPTPPLVEEGVC